MSPTTRVLRSQTERQRLTALEDHCNKRPYDVPGQRRVRAKSLFPIFDEEHVAAFYSANSQLSTIRADLPRYHQNITNLSGIDLRTRRKGLWDIIEKLKKMKRSVNDRELLTRIKESKEIAGNIIRTIGRELQHRHFH